MVCCQQQPYDYAESARARATEVDESPKLSGALRRHSCRHASEGYPYAAYGQSVMPLPQAMRVTPRQ